MCIECRARTDLLKWNSNKWEGVDQHGNDLIINGEIYVNEPTGEFEDAMANSAGLAWYFTRYMNDRASAIPKDRISRLNETVPF